jgi:hypothetical protein
MTDPLVHAARAAESAAELARNRALHAARAAEQEFHEAHAAWQVARSERLDAEARSER